MENLDYLHLSGGYKPVEEVAQAIIELLQAVGLQLVETETRVLDKVSEGEQLTETYWDLATSEGSIRLHFSSDGGYGTESLWAEAYKF